MDKQLDLQGATATRKVFEEWWPTLWAPEAARGLAEMNPKQLAWASFGAGWLAARAADSAEGGRHEK